MRVMPLNPPRALPSLYRLAKIRQLSALRRGDLRVFLAPVHSGRRYFPMAAGSAH